MLEKTVEEIVRRFPREVFPDLDLTFVEGQRRLAGGNVLDLRFSDARGVGWVLELKRGPVTTRTIDQLARYVAAIEAAEGGARLEGIAVGFAITPAVAAVAAARGIHVRVLKEETLRAIAQRHGVPLDHVTGHRPTLASTNRSPSLVPRPRGTRPATDPSVVAFIRALDARFPPGTLDGRVPTGSLHEYWALACPSAPAAQQTLAATLSLSVLTTVPGTAIAARSHSVSDPYTTIRAGDGRVAAAIDARTDYVKLDFPLPPDVANELRTQGLLRIWQPRGYSVWVLSRVARKLTPERAHQLLELGLNWEFKGERS